MIEQKDSISTELRFLKNPLADLLVLSESLTHTVALFLRSMLGFDFQSPLNFIMIHDDFHRFYRTFYHTEMLVKYSFNIFTDSLFSIYHLRSPTLAKQAKLDSLAKQGVATQMQAAIESEINDAIKLLTQYSSLVEHD